MKGSLLKSLVSSLFEVVQNRCTQDEIVIICPNCVGHDASGNRSVNLKTGLTNCWRCNKGGDFVKWARWLGYAVQDEGVANSSIEELVSTLETPRSTGVPVPVISEISLPKGFRCCYDYPNSEYTKQIGLMAKRKHLELDDLVAAGVGFTKESMKWEPFAIFPVLEYDRLVYYQGRTYWDDPGQSTKKFPDRVEAPLSSKYWLHNIDAARDPKVDTVVVVESILNVLSLKKKFAQLGIVNMVPVCVFKHAVSKPQFYKLMRLQNIKEAVMLFDFDAIELSWHDAKKVDDLIRVSVAEMPFTANLKLDPNDDVDAACTAIANRRPFTMAGLLERKLKTAELSYFVPFLGGTLFDRSHPVTPQDCIHKKLVL